MIDCSDGDSHFKLPYKLLILSLFFFQCGSLFVGKKNIVCFPLLLVVGRNDSCDLDYDKES
jgi:hypothetical protein